MTYAQIYQAVQNTRFNAAILSTAGGIKDWIRAREAEVWQYADWPIKDSSLIAISIVAGAAVVNLPPGVTITPQLIQVFDENGIELDFMDPAEFFEEYQPRQVPSVSPGPGEAWTITTDPLSGSGAMQLRVGPTPNAARSYTVRGWTLPIKRTAAATWSLGTMSADTDLPWWPDDFHDFLVDGAVARGKRLQSDPSWPNDEQAFQAGMARLEDTLIPTGRVGAEQWGTVWR